jgi:hypothetical protein
MDHNMARSKKKPEHYVDNAKFTQAVHEYVMACREAEECGEDVPPVTNYIGECFYKIATGLTYTRKFIRRTYKEELAMDAIEDCLKRIRNYNIDASTRTGKPNAFAYFTQICYYSFLRTVERHNKELRKKLRFIEKTAIEIGASTEYGDTNKVLEYLDEVRAPWENAVPQPKKEEPKPKVEKAKGLEKFAK